jgi:transposase
MTEEQAAQLIDQNRLLAEKVVSLEAELKQQKAITSELLKRIYGKKSEQMDSAQLLLLLQEDDAKKPDAAEPGGQEPEAESKARKPRAKRSSKLSESLKDLPFTERVVTAPEVLANPGNYRLIGEEVSERLKVSPQTFTREVIRRQTHVKRGDLDGAPITPPLEPCLLPGSVLTPSLGAMLLTEKFCYHQPFYRLEWRLRASHGIELRRDLMCSWHNHLAEMLLPLHERLKTRMRASDYLKVDETPIRCLDPGAGRTRQGYLWTYHHPEHGVLFDWHNSRAADCLNEVLIDTDRPENSFGGHLQSDGYSAYRAFIARHPELEIQPVSCLAHIRRKFTEAREDQPRISAWVLMQIARIYELEARLRERGADPELRRRARRRWSMKRYHHLIRLTNHLILNRRITPRSPLGKALHYAHDQWPHLEACFEHGRIDFDNNSTENAIRPTKLGAKNWMFVGGEDTGWRSAVIYTFVEQVRAHGADPFRYLEWVFTELMHQPNPGDDQLDALMPTAWIKQQREAKKKIA